MPAILFNMAILAAVALHIALVERPHDRRELATVSAIHLSMAGLVLSLTPAEARAIVLLAFGGPYLAVGLSMAYRLRQIRRLPWPGGLP